MSILLGKYSILIPIVLLLAVLASWQSPPARFLLLVLFLLFSIARALVSVIAKHQAARLQGSIISTIFVRNVLIETVFLLSLMVLAGFLAWHIAQVTTQQISNDFLRFAAGIATGLLVGIGVGAALHPLWGRFIKTSAGN